MSIVFTDVITSELGALTTPALALIRDDNAQLPLMWEHNAYFHGLVTTTPAARARQSFTVPFDMLLETMAVRHAGFNASSVLTVSVTAPGVLDSFPVTASASPTAFSPGNIPRIQYDNTKGRATLADSPASRAARILYAGTRCSISVATTVNATAGAFLMVTLCFRGFFARGAS